MPSLRLVVEVDHRIYFRGVLASTEERELFARLKFVQVAGLRSRQTGGVEDIVGDGENALNRWGYHGGVMSVVRKTGIWIRATETKEVATIHNEICAAGLVESGS